MRTKDDVEVDLILERPGLKRAAVEIKSTERTGPDDVRALKRIAPDIPNCQAYCLSLDPAPKIIDGVACLPWKRGLVELGLSAGVLLRSDGRTPVVHDFETILCRRNSEYFLTI